MEKPFIATGQAPNFFHIGPRPTLNPEVARKRSIHDQQMTAFHAYLDEAAKDTRHKYERPSFIVVTASEAFRRGWEAIFSPQEHSAPGK